MTALVIARTALTRLFRDRSNYFFVFIFPIALVLLIGAQFGSGFAPSIGVAAPAGDEFAAGVVTVLSADYDVRSYGDAETAVRAVERGAVNAAMVFPSDFSRGALAGAVPEVQFFTQPNSAGQAIRAAASGALDTVLASPSAALSIADELGNIDFDRASQLIDGVQSQVAGVEVETTSTGDALFENLGQFDLGASSQLVLFVFLTGLTGSAALIQSRQLGVTRRMLSTPASSRMIILGEVLGRWAVALFQGIYILVVTLVVFRVDWGDPVGALTLIGVFSLVGASAAMLFGALFRNDQQAAGISVVAALGLAALGGSMVPIEIFSPTMQTIAKFTPHAWANSAFAELVRRGGSVLDIMSQLGVLVLFSAGLLTVAIWRLQKVITR